ncbi:Protoheme IX farnesyltransferase [bacterium HR40]|nr:Protoheme IX farnesyltransferase [bacterium HR40]
MRRLGAALETALVLGRVSNLPTVWTNGLAGWVVAGGSPLDPALLPLLAALSAFYVGGMYLNDAFDAAIDARHRPERPIPSGRVAAGTVFFLGMLLLLAGLGLLLATTATSGRDPTAAQLHGLLLALCILVYDFRHKELAASPLLMGACRGLVYLLAGACVVPLPSTALGLAALAGFAHVVGLSWVARQEHPLRREAAWPLALFALSPIVGLGFALAHPLGLVSWLALVAASGMALALFARRRPGDVGRAVALLIAAICLLDGCLLATAGWPALLGPSGFALTLLLQPLVRGT